MTVTWAWLRNHADKSRLGSIWPALLIVPDGSRAEIEKSIAQELDNGGWRVVTHNEGVAWGLPARRSLMRCLTSA